MDQTKRSLWMRFASISQPYFFPAIPRGGLVTVLLMVLLLFFLFGVLFIIVAGIALAANFFAPSITSEVALQFLSLITEIFHSHKWLILAATLIVPAAVFAMFGSHLKQRRQAWMLLAVVLLLSLSVTALNVAISYVGNYFTNALVKKNQHTAYLFIGVYFSCFLVGIPIVAFYRYVQSYLGLRWREWLTGQFVSNYFKRRNYYEVEANAQIDNPDQRISEDIRTFTRMSLAFLLIILSSLMDLISFTGILWSKSVLLVVVVLCYSAIGTTLTFLIGRRLVRLNFNQLRYEADFRYSLVHVRNNSESIAFYQGEKPENEPIWGRFRGVLRNFGLLIGWQRNLSFFTTSYSYLPVVLPFLVLFPNTSAARSNTGTWFRLTSPSLRSIPLCRSLSRRFDDITNFAAGVERLSTFSDALMPENAPVPGIKSQDADKFALTDVTLLTPNRTRTLIEDLKMNLDKGDDLVVVGQSGVGKSSLLRAIAGLWTQGAGNSERPPLSHIFFLPQKPYMLLGTLRDQLLYPRFDKEISEAANEGCPQYGESE